MASPQPGTKEAREFITRELEYIDEKLEDTSYSDIHDRLNDKLVLYERFLEYTLIVESWKTLLNETKNMLYRLYNKRWGESKSDMNNIMNASRKYSYHYDRILNNVIRGREINEIVYQHFNDSVKGYDNWVYSESAYDRFKEPCGLLRNPLTNPSISGSPETVWRDYVNSYFKEVRQLHSSMLRYSLKLKKPMRVYRGLKIQQEMPDWINQASGFTSTTYDIYESIQMMMADYDGTNPYPELSEFVILSIDLPAGTNIFTTNFCTIQIEDEIILTDEGELRITGSDYFNFYPWLSFTDENGVRQNPSGSEWGRVQENLTARVRMINMEFIPRGPSRIRNLMSIKNDCIEWGFDNIDRIIAAIYI